MSGFGFNPDGGKFLKEQMISIKQRIYVINIFIWTLLFHLDLVISEFAPVDVSRLGLTAEPAGATFSLAAAQVTDDGTATFNLTPSVDGDGMTFNLTPVLEQQGQQYSSAPDLDMSPFTRELAGQAIAFSPPLVSATSTTLTPDFTGLLPPPPPTHSAKTSPAGEPPTFSPPAFMEPFYGKSPGRPLTPPPPSQHISK